MTAEPDHLSQKDICQLQQDINKWQSQYGLFISDDATTKFLFLRIEVGKLVEMTEQEFVQKTSSEENLEKFYATVFNMMSMLKKDLGIL